jgi:acyl phosphate:glycerol-3-phosphate acyltransferase
MVFTSQSSPAGPIILAVLVLGISYLIGSIPWAYLIVRKVAGEDITAHGTGNVGAMNVRRTTGSWAWFAVDVVADGMKGLVPVAAARMLVMGPSASALLVPWGIAAQRAGFAGALAILAALPPLAVAGAVMGHNYSLWLAVRAKRFTRTGKGLATGAGALLAYDWRYLIAVVAVALIVIAVTRYMMAGQVAAAFTLPVTAAVLRSPDWPFALLMGLVVYAAHHKRFMGLLRGKEPKLYVDDGSGPRG